MAGDNRYQRLHVDDDLGDGAAIVLDAGQTHYLKDVMRQQAGDSVHLFNGRDGEWRARIEGHGKRGTTATVERRVRTQESEPDLWLVFAPVKGGRVENMVEKATELGVSRLLPVVTQRTVVTRINQRRLRVRTIEAAEQCGRLTVPVISALQPLVDVVRDWPDGRRLLWCDESGGGDPIAAALAAAGPGPWAVMTGPEGGYASSELDALRKLPFVTAVSLGGRILRADTAAIAALACLQAVAGDWRQTSPSFVS
ncbi:MAG: 16S rRNA (uracil(1498)-N(3))-methyltransferase [Alphaproteobacteria bacterium]|nr:16S rRNA (uracil(1498)-N(3))-methyltransferase [Alphaproteobacteria bacterium]